MYQKSITHKLIRFQKSWFFLSNCTAKKRQIELFMKVHSGIKIELCFWKVVFQQSMSKRRHLHKSSFRLSVHLSICIHWINMWNTWVNFSTDGEHVSEVIHDHWCKNTNWYFDMDFRFLFSYPMMKCHQITLHLCFRRRSKRCWFFCFRMTTICNGTQLLWLHLLFGFIVSNQCFRTNKFVLLSNWTKLFNTALLFKKRLSDPLNTRPQSVLGRSQ